MDSRLLRVAAILAPAAFAVAILSGFALPMYTDEVGWRLQERAGLDGVDKLFSLLCGPTSLATPPIWMMPVRHYSAFWNVQFPSPFYTRMSGILYALIWGALLARLIVRIAPDVMRRRAILAFGFALLTLGVMPWLLTWSRPEQPILIAMTAALLIACEAWDAPRPTGRGLGWLRVAGVVVLAGIAYSYHLKAVFLVPVFLVCLLTCAIGRGHWPARIAGTAVLALLTAQSARYWVDRLACPVDQAFLQTQNVASKLLYVRTPGDFALVVAEMLGNLNPLPYIARTVPRPNPLSSWLAEEQIAMTPALIGWGIATLAWCLGLVFAGKAVIEQVKVSRERIDPRLFVFGAMLVSFLGWTATQPMKVDYEAILMVPLLLLILVVALSCRAAPAHLFDKVRGTAVIACGVAVASMVMVGVIYAPSLRAAIGQPGYLAQQRSSISQFGYEARRQRLLKLGKSCGIDPVNSQNLVLDDETYFTFMRSRTPDHAFGRFGPGRDSDLTIDYLRGRQSSGYIAACKLLPKPLQSQARRDGNVCCLAPTWNAPTGNAPATPLAK